MNQRGGDMNLALVIKNDTFEQLRRVKEEYHADTFDDAIRHLIHDMRRA